MPGGRPTDYSEEIAFEICERLAMGEPLSRICEDDAMPAFTTAWRWQQKHVEFRNNSLQAMQYGTHFLAGDCLRISDDPTLSPGEKRIRIDTRLRLIGKWNAKAYGDKVALTGGGPDDAPIRHSHDLSALTTAELEALHAIRSKLAIASGDRSGDEATEG